MNRLAAALLFAVAALPACSSSPPTPLPGSGDTADGLNRCALLSDQDACNAAADCEWHISAGGSTDICIPNGVECESITDSDQCDSAANCEWYVGGLASGSQDHCLPIGPLACEEVTDPDLCAMSPDCEWYVGGLASGSQDHCMPSGNDEPDGCAAHDDEYDACVAAGCTWTALDGNDTGFCQDPEPEPACADLTEYDDCVYHATCQWNDAGASCEDAAPTSTCFEHDDQYDACVAAGCAWTGLDGNDTGFCDPVHFEPGCEDFHNNRTECEQLGCEFTSTGAPFIGLCTLPPE